MVITYILFALGIYLLVKSADWIIDSSSSLAKKLGVSSLVIGLTVVAFGTSLPELVINLFAAFKGASQISLGNIIGSNVTNILLILGITAIVGNISIKSETAWKQIPFALLSAFVLFALTSEILFGKDGLLTRNDGLILLALFATFLYYAFRTSPKKQRHTKTIEDIATSNLKIASKFAIGLIGIYFGGRWVVDGAVLIASQLGFSEYLISATVIAIGTSLPELAVSIIATMKKNIDLAVGNIIGSNIANTLWILGLVPLISPLKIPSFIGFDIAIMFLVTLLLFIVMFVGKKHGVSKKTGAIFIVLYILYIAYIISRG